MRNPPPPSTIPKPSPKRRRRRQTRSSSATATLMLVAATYEPDVSVRLTFDRPIDIAGLDASQIIVDDAGIEGKRYAGTGAGEIGDPETVNIDLVQIDSAEGTETTLSASGSSGIVAVDDGGLWAGVSGVELPFP